MMSTDQDIIKDLRASLRPLPGAKYIVLRHHSPGPILDADAVKELIDTLEKRLRQHSIGSMLGDDSMLVNPLEKLAIRLLLGLK